MKRYGKCIRWKEDVIKIGVRKVDVKLIAINKNINPVIIKSHLI